MWLTAPRVALLVCLALLLAQPLVAILRTPDRLAIYPSLHVDAIQYDGIARTLIRSRTLDAIPPLQPPGFVLLLAALYAVTGPSWLAARLFLWVVFVLCTSVAGWLAWRIDGRERSGWAAALLTASSAALQAYSGTIQYEVIAALWLLVLAGAAEGFVHRSANVAAVLAHAAVLAVLMAAAVLTREVLIAVVPVLAVYLGAQIGTRFGRRDGVIVGIVIVLVAAAPVVAWAVFQSHRSGRAVALSDKGPLVLAFGNNPHANGTFNAPLANVVEPSGWAFIRARPAASLTLAGRKFLYFWGILRDGWNVPRRAGLWLARAAGGLVPLDWVLPITRGGWILLALAVGLAAWPRSIWQAWWHVPACIAAVLSVHLLTVSSHRFAVPVLPLAFAIIAGPAAAAASWATRSLRRRLVCTMTLAVLVAMQITAWPLQYRLKAVEMEGLEAVNRIDPARGPVRYADAARGARAVLSMGDEFLPYGQFAVTVSYRAPVGPVPATALARARLRTLDDRPVCETEITASPDSAGAWQAATMECAFDRDEVATLAIETTGAVDLEFGDVVLTWR